MKENSNETTGKTAQESENGYNVACKQQEMEIEYHTQEIFDYLKRHKLNQWAQLEILNKVRKLEEDSLGTIVDPQGIDVAEEEIRLQDLYEEIRCNTEIARSVLSLIDSPGYKFRDLSIDQIWEIAAQYHW